MKKQRKDSLLGSVIPGLKTISKLIIGLLYGFIVWFIDALVSPDMFEKDYSEDMWIKRNGKMVNITREKGVSLSFRKTINKIYNIINPITLLVSLLMALSSKVHKFLDTNFVRKESSYLNLPNNIP